MSWVVIFLMFVIVLSLVLGLFFLYSSHHNKSSDRLLYVLCLRVVASIFLLSLAYWHLQG